MDFKESKKKFEDLLSKKNDKIALFILMAVLGVMLIFISNAIFAPQDSTSNTKENVTLINASEYKLSLENDLKAALSKVKGVGEVEVVVTLKGEAKEAIAYNETTSSSQSSNENDKTNEQSTTKKDAIIVKEGNESKPYTTNYTYPDVVGVMIIAKGADDVNVKYYITESVKTLLNIASHKIIVLPMDEQ